MFSSVLRGHALDEAGRQVADSIDGALAAQDGILASLLDISRMESGQLEVRLRDFEAPMCGAFYLVEHMRELADFFEEDKEMVFYRDARELVDKARFYLANDAPRERIALAGRRRALAEHTWQHRFRAAFRAAGLG